MVKYYSMTKYELIRQKRQETFKRHKQMSCKVYCCKIDYSHLSKIKKNYLKRLFLEAKWLRNYLVSSEDIFKETYKHNIATILNKNKEKEERTIKYLSSQMKQGILNGIKDNIKGLKSNKNKGKKVGKLKFKSRINSINLQQKDITYRIENDKYFRLQGFKGSFRVDGLNQIPDNAEIANAKLLRKESGYYLSVTCFVPKEKRIKTGKDIGLDFGIKSHITDSEGNKYKWNFQESRKSKRLQRKIGKTYKKGQKSSSNRNYRKHLNRLENEKLFYKKKDTINKFVSNLKRNYDLICIQNESIYEWKSSKRKGWGKSIQYSIMGGIISGIKRLPQTQIVDKWEPTTQICLSCGKKTKHELSERVFHCSCGYEEDRDINSAKVILKISKGLRNTMPGENLTNTGEYPLGYSLAS